MKKGMILGLLGLAFIAGLGLADDLFPVAVSPGLPNKTAVVRESCPTFSWTAVSWALTYKVVVFEAAGEEVPTYENMVAAASPVLVKEIPGQALSWTPSADESLSNGGSYFWYVGAMNNAAQGSWSEGRRFMVAEGPAWGVVAEPREDGIGESPARTDFRDKDLELMAAAKENFDLTSGFRSEVQGSEGATNTFYGLTAGVLTTTGSCNSFFGRAAGGANTTGSYNTFMGYLAGRYSTTASENTFLGYMAGYKNTTGYENTCVGISAGKSNTTGYWNTFVGVSAGNRNTTGNSNAFLGSWAGYVNTTGYWNTFVGFAAGYKNTTGYENTFVGWCAGNDNTTGKCNTFLGLEAGYVNTIGQRNVFLGRVAGASNMDGSCNTFVGNGAGYRNTSGMRNVFLGYSAGYNEDGSDKLYIANSDTVAPLIYGDFGADFLKFNGKIGIKISPTHLLDVGTSGAYCNGGAWVDGSSREFKENIEELTTEEAQQAFEKLEPVKFNYKENKDETYLGFIAEDVPDLVAMNDRKGLNPMDMVAMLTKVVQEQMKVNQEQQKEISELKEKITKLEKRSRKEK